MAIDALQAGLHVYIEKPMTHNISETYALRDAVHESGKCYRLGISTAKHKVFWQLWMLLLKNIGSCFVGANQHQPQR